MAVEVLQHINIRAADVERSKDFYVRVLGLRVGPRPPVASFGYWLYLGGEPVIHLVQRAPDSPPAAATGAIDHVAFRGVDLAETRGVLQAQGVPFREALIPRDGTVQLFLHDPDGVKIELNFDPACPP
jgi:catechol 2,3-dioxygenase-like lactoylglutathione lyase family enzyme